MQGSNPTGKRVMTRNGQSSINTSRTKIDVLKVPDSGDTPGMKVYARLRRKQSHGEAAHVQKQSRPMQLRKTRSESLAVVAWQGEEKLHGSGTDDDDIDANANFVQEEAKQEMEVFDDKEMDLPNQNTISTIIDHKSMDHLSSNDHIEENSVGDEETMTFSKGSSIGIVDLVMWRDISKSALVFGLGTFFLVSSSYTKDLNFSIISAISYMGLAYLGAIFLYKSIIHRGADDFDEPKESYPLGEEDIMWLVRLLLPYMNEVLLNIGALFSGDPATTIKLAAFLFVMARCGSSITIWTLAKLVFFGVFTIPKVCSSYSVQLARYGKFWLERFRDGWDSCTHKKVVAAAIFTFIWNISSTIARVWAVFMLIVAVKYYQQSIIAEEYNGQKEMMNISQERQEDSTPTPCIRMGTKNMNPRSRSWMTPTKAGTEKRLNKSA